MMEIMKLTHFEKKRWRLSAFTIAEVVVSALVLGITGSTLVLALSSGFSLLQTTREDVRATQILMQKMEAIRLCTWSELTDFKFQESYDPLDASHSRGAVYFGSVSIAPAGSVPSAASYAPNMRLVTAQLSWTNYNGRIAVPHFRQAQTQAARYGLQSYLWGAIR